MGLFANKYIVEEAPWKVEDMARVQTVLNNLSYALAVLTELYEPIIPEEAQKAREALRTREKIVLFPKIV